MQTMQETMQTLKKHEFESENMDPINMTEYLEQNRTADSNV